MHEENLKKNMRRVLLIFTGMFIALILNITYLQVVKRADLANHPLNMRAGEWERTMRRGDIYDQNNKKIAYSEKGMNGEFFRVYPLAEALAQIVGYIDPEIGRAGIESYGNEDLSGRARPLNQFGAIRTLFDPGRGNNIKLTIDSALQRCAYRALGDHRGAVVVLNVKTGAVLAMASKPSFDPNTLKSNWLSLRNREDAPLLNRASQGLYPPGSIWKTIIADAALKEKVIAPATVYNCPGFLKLDDNYTMYEINHAAHGEVNLEAALAVSCNITFGNLALKLGSNRLEKAWERFGFERNLGNEIIEASCRIPNLRELSDGDLCQIGIGQSGLLVTPLRMAALAGAFANDGKMMKPYLIDEIISFNGDILDKKNSEIWLRVTDEKTAQTILQDMRLVVKNGTAGAAAVAGVSVAGKTGTAENASGRPHAWFIGSAAARDKSIAIAVLVENGGGGGTVAAPIARKMITDFFKNEGVIE